MFLQVMSGKLRPCLLLWRMLRYRLLRGRWLWGYLRNHVPFRRPVTLLPERLTDVIVTVVDHFEPDSRGGEQAATSSVKNWCEGYRAIAARHVDADGRHPQHSWFYRAEYPNYGCISVLSEECFAGFGEIEFHLHHGHDTEESFSEKLQQGVAFFNQCGAMVSAEELPAKRFAYIAGNWSLDNGSGDDSKSGCNTEIAALRRAGCYADFTFPALGSHAQPRKTNSIYYAVDGPEPKSYDTGEDMQVGGTAEGDLLLMQGPTVVRIAEGRIEDGAVEFFAHPSPARLDAWLAANVHVKGRPEWLFVKLHCHGMQSQKVFHSEALDATFAAMVEMWNQPPFRLHFVTAREAYNIAKAAEAGETGNAGDYRDYVIAPPANRTVLCTVPWQLVQYGWDRIQLDLLSEDIATVRFSAIPGWHFQGQMKGVCITGLGEGRVEVTVTGSYAIRAFAEGQELCIDPGIPWTPPPLWVAQEKLIASTPCVSE